MNVNDAEEDEEEDENEDMINHPNALHVSKPLDTQIQMTSPNKFNKSPIGFDALSPLEQRKMQIELHQNQNKSFSNTMRSNQHLD